MPSIRQYTATESTRGRALNNTRAQPQGVDLSGVIDQAAKGAQVALDLQDAQRRASEQLQLNEARMQVANTMSEAAVFWTEKMQAAQTQAPKGAAGFTDSTLQEFDGWAKRRTEGTMHPQARKLLEDNLRRMRQGIHAEAFNFEVKQRNAALVDDFSAGVDADIAAVSVDPSRWADAAARRLALAEALALPADVRQKLTDNTRERLAVAAAQGIINQEGGAAAFLAMAGARSAKGRRGQGGGSAPDAAERVATNPILSSMSPQALTAAIDRASTIVAQQEAQAEAERLRRQGDSEAAANRRERAASRGFNILSALYTDGRNPDPTSPTVQGALKAIEGTPYAAAYREMLKEAPQARAAALQPLPQQEAELQALYARRNQASSPELEREIKRREQVLASARKDYAAEPLLAAVERGVRGVEALAPVDMTDLGTIQQTVGARVQQAGLAAEKVGRPVSPFTGQEAQQLMARVATQPVPQRAQTLATLAESLPREQADALARQLDTLGKGDQNRAFAAALHAGADRTTAGRFTAELVLKGAEALQSKTIKEERTPVDGWRGRISAVTQAAFRNPQEAEFVAEKARFILAGLVAEGGSSSERMVTQAVSLAAGGSIRDHNGARIPLPAGMEPGDFRRQLETLPADALNLPDGRVYVNTGAGMQALEAADFLKTLPASRLAYVRRGVYAVQVGATFAAKADGSPVLIEVGR